jgi:hypothetical protein
MTASRSRDCCLPAVRLRARHPCADSGSRTCDFEERGLDTLFLALGLATWTADDEGRSPCAPVLLLPLKATQTGSRSGTWSVARAGELKVNDVLLHALQAEHGVAVSADNLVPEILGDDEGGVRSDPVFDRLKREASRVRFRRATTMGSGNLLSEACDRQSLDRAPAGASAPRHRSWYRWRSNRRTGARFADDR